VLLRFSASPATARRRSGRTSRPISTCVQWVDLARVARLAQAARSAAAAPTWRRPAAPTAPRPMRDGRRRKGMAGRTLYPLLNPLGGGIDDEFQASSFESSLAKVIGRGVEVGYDAVNQRRYFRIQKTGATTFARFLARYNRHDLEWSCKNWQVQVHSDKKRASSVCHSMEGSGTKGASISFPHISSFQAIDSRNRATR